ncbi:MAG: FHA domain-containing protein [Deltaproteobacteria bacterium]|nr:FHA domain-containing protein [Deltaproteobacteria bacterium]MBW2137017.1 FHA domain-containing protein [Deltaproteobacteria bacterium]
MTRIYILNGPDQGKVFDFEKDTIYVGRSSDNDLQILDRTVSLKHLRIKRTTGGRYLLTDLKSQNGTFFNGNFLSAGIDLEVREGVPIMIGMSIICIGQGCREHLSSFAGPSVLEGALDGNKVIFEERRHGTDQKRRELIYRIYDVLMKEDIKEALEGVIDNIFHLLKRVDRAAIVVSDPEKEGLRKVIFKSRKPSDDAQPVYCSDIVDRVLEKGKAVVISDCRAGVEEDLAETLRILRIESVMCVPLIGISKIIGAFYVDSLNKPYGFRKEDLSLFYDLSRRTAMAIEYGWFTSKL